MGNNTLRKGITFTYENDDGDEVVAVLPSKKVVCGRCEGHGSHLNPSIGEHAYTPEEFNREYDDEEREQYFKRGGIYDVTCLDCKGANVVDVIDEEACKRDPELTKLLKVYEEKEEADAAYESMCAAERRMGA